MKNNRFMKALLFLLLPFSVFGQTLTNDKIDIIAGAGIYSVNAVIYKPAGYTTTKKYPLVIFSHGTGEAGTDINKLYGTGLPKVLRDGYKPSIDFIMVAPQRSSYSIDPGWLQGIIEDAVKRFPIDTPRIYLTGLSAGGWLVYGSQLNVDTSIAKRIAAIVPLSAATQDANKNNFDRFKITRVPVWAVVGNSDVSYRDQNIFMVNSINSKVPNLAIITIRPGVGHGGWNDVYNGTVKTSDGKNIWEWLYQFKKGAAVTPPPPPPPPIPLPAYDFKVGDTLSFKVFKLNDSTLHLIRIK